MPLAANPAESDDGTSRRLRSASTVDIYRDIHHSLDLLMERTLVIETVTQENAKILPRFAALEQHARVHGEAGSHSCAPGQNRAPERPSQLEGVASNDLTQNVAGPTFPAAALPTGGGLTGMQASENSQDENAHGARLLSHSDQASNAPQSANSASCRDNHYEDVETSTSSESNMSFPSARNVRDQLDPSVSVHTVEENDLQTLPIAAQSHTRSQPTTGDMLSDQVESPECRSPLPNRKRPLSQHEQEDEPLERIAETFGVDSDLEYFEQIIDHAKASAHWISCAWTPRTLLTSDVDPLQFVQALPTLVKELDDNDFAGRLLEVKQRMALAHFYSVYRSAHENHEMFLRWTDRLGNSGVSLTSCDGLRTESAVKQRFIDVCVWQCPRDRKQAAVKINNWQRCGRPWAAMIGRLGYSSLLLVPPDMTNKR